MSVPPTKLPPIQDMPPAGGYAKVSSSLAETASNLPSVLGISGVGGASGPSMDMSRVTIFA